MNPIDLQLQISQLERVLRLRVPHSRVADVLRELFAMRIGNAVLDSAEARFPNEVRAARTSAQLQGCPEEWRLPSVDVVSQCGPALLEAVSLQDASAAVAVLRRMNLFALCTSPNQQIERLEFRVGCVLGRPRLIPLIELAALAVDTGADDRACVYIQEAYTLRPEAPEKHDLHTLSGITALCRSKLDEARTHLMESVRVCQEDDFSRLSCSIRPFNLKLAEGLLHRGDREVVIRYLSACKDVWVYEAKRIACWIDAIHDGKGAEFSSATIRNALAV